MSWKQEVQFPAKARDFSALHRAQTGSEAIPASYAISSGDYFPGDRAVMRLNTQLLLMPYVLIAWGLINKTQGQFFFCHNISYCPESTLRMSN
jgi:hypothetical protein